MGKIPTSAGLKNAYTKIRGRWVGKSSQHMGIECIFKWLILESVQSFSFFVLLWELCLLLVSSVYDYSLLVLRKVLSSFINVSRAVLSRRIFKVFVVGPLLSDLFASAESEIFSFLNVTGSYLSLNDIFRYLSFG